MEEYRFEYDPEKDALLQKERGISFDQMIALIAEGKIIRIRPHHNTAQYPHQDVIEIDGGELVYLVPCVISEDKIFLKTAYPDRKATKRKKRGKK